VLSIVFNIKHLVWRKVQNKNNTSLFLPWMTKATNGPIALTPEIDCDQTAMDLPPNTSAVILITKSVW
jgi:hypothetical protein